MEHPKQFQTKYFESTQFFINQKDSLINQLRAEIYELRAKGKEYDKLKVQMSQLENEFRRNVQDNSNRTQTFKSRISETDTNQYSLQVTLDSLRSQIQQQSYQHSQLTDELARQRAIADRRKEEITNIAAAQTDTLIQTSSAQERLEKTMGSISQARDRRTDVTLKIQDVEHEIEVVVKEQDKVNSQFKEASQSKQSQQQRKNEQTLEMASIETSIAEKDQILARLQSQVAEKRKVFYASSEQLGQKKNELDDQCLKVKAQSRQLKEGDDSRTDLEERIRQLETANSQLELRQDHLQQQSAYLHDLNEHSNCRIVSLNEEKDALRNLVSTLTMQNKEIVQELDDHVKTNEHVRKQLDRKQYVGHLMDNFNKDLIESKLLVEQTSPLRYMNPASLNHQQEIHFSDQGSRMNGTAGSNLKHLNF